MKAKWKEVWYKDYPALSNGNSFYVQAVYENWQGVVILRAREMSIKNESGFNMSTDRVWQKLCNNADTYVEAIEWAQEIAAQWFTKWRLEQSQNADK